MDATDGQQSTSSRAQLEIFLKKKRETKKSFINEDKPTLFFPISLSLRFGLLSPCCYCYWRFLETISTPRTKKREGALYGLVMKVCSPYWSAREKINEEKDPRRPFSKWGVPPETDSVAAPVQQHRVAEMPSPPFFLSYSTQKNKKSGGSLFFLPIYLTDDSALFSRCQQM